MSIGWWIAALAAGFVLAPFLWVLRDWRASRRAGRIPPGWREILARRLRQLRLLNPQQRTLYEQRVQAFLATKRFVACNGLALDDEMRVLIAGLACLLILRPHARVFPHLRSVLVYPEAFVVPQTEPDELGLVSEEGEERIGESWSHERVILSWPEVESALAGDEINVVAHEFAHQLDDQKAGREGAPAVVDAQRWKSVMQTEYERLRRHRRPPVLDPYGAESPAEFFAVATEAFFQRGAELQRHHAALYELLRDYYLLDTARLDA